MYSEKNKPLVLIRKGRLALRSWEPDDLMELVSLANHHEIARNMRDGFPFPYTEEDARNFIEKSIMDIPMHVFAITRDNALCGSIGFFRKENVYRLNAEIGYWIGIPFWNQGIATEAVQQLCSWLFSHTDIIRITAHVFSINPASMRVLAKAGFQKEAVLKNALVKDTIILDEHLFVLLK